MKAIMFTILAIGMALSQAQAQSQSVAVEMDRACLASAISAVEKYHTIGEGKVYALRVLYKGTFGAALLVGHADETDPTDYLVSVDLAGSCKVKSIVYSEDANMVAKYTEQEFILAHSLKLESQALKLLQKIPASGYDSRSLCIVGKQVTATVPMSHWSKNDRKTATGTLKNFPEKYMAFDSSISFTGGQSELIQGSEGNGIYVVKGTVNGKPADICLSEVKPVLESAF